MGGYFEFSKGPNEPERSIIDREPEIFPIGEVPDNIVYLLPHELEIAQARIAALIEHQSNLSTALGEAMEQSSETFHDNAPQEAVVADAVVLVERARPIIELLKKYRLATYPEDSTIVTLGTRVTLSLNGKDPFTIDVVGASWLHESYEDGIDKASYDAPVVSGILGHEAGEEITCDINGRSMKIKTISVDKTPFSEG